MKKYFGIILGIFILITFGIILNCHAYSNTSTDLQDFKQAQNELKKYVPYYQNLATCTPYKTDLYKIYGKVNDSCHLFMVDNIGQTYDCNVPMVVARVNSSYGKSTFNKLANMNLDNLNQMSDIERYMNEITQIMRDIQTLSGLESNMLQYHCKKMN